MSTAAAATVGFDLLLRDLRHMEARAASDLADWLVHLDLEGKSDRTLYGYHRQIAALLRANPDKQLGDYTHTDVNDVLRLTPERSRHITRSILNSFFGWAVWDQRIDRNPMDRVPRIRNPKRRPRDIYSEEEVALLEGLPSPHGHLFTILFTTGLRRGEARKLRRDHVDLNRERLIVYSGKGGKDRIVPLPLSACQAVADLDLTEGLQRDEYVFALARNPRYRTRRYMTNELGDTTFERWYATQVEQAGVRYLNPHQTRHTYGHRLRELRFDLEERQLLMGHESIRTTQHYYGHLTIEDVARKISEAGL